MITGGSTANLAIILIDARTGVITQTRRHTYLVSLLGIKHVVLAVNKMDLVDYSQERFDEIVNDYMAFAEPLGIPDIKPFPISALKGDNVVEKSDVMPWYEGTALLPYLETVEIGNDRNMDSFRFPVQYVLRPNPDFRGFSGRVASGVLHKGDEIVSLPSGKTSKVKGIHIYEGEKELTFAGESVTITLEDEIDLSRGEMLVKVDDQPMMGRMIDAMLVWMDEEKMDRSKKFFLKQTTQMTRSQIDKIDYRVDVNTMEQSACDALSLNEIARVKISTNKVLLFDKYSDNRSCGSFILIDPISNNTSAVGMILGAVDSADASNTQTLGASFTVSEGAELLSNQLRQMGKATLVVDLEELTDEATIKVCESAAQQGIYAIGVVAGGESVTQERADELIAALVESEDK